jgi:hypothetical protein
VESEIQESLIDRPLQILLENLMPAQRAAM